MSTEERSRLNYDGRHWRGEDPQRGFAVCIDDQTFRRYVKASLQEQGIDFIASTKEQRYDAIQQLREVSCWEQVIDTGVIVFSCVNTPQPFQLPPGMPVNVELYLKDHGCLVVADEKGVTVTYPEGSHRVPVLPRGLMGEYHVITFPDGEQVQEYYDKNSKRNNFFLKYDVLHSSSSDNNVS